LDKFLSKFKLFFLAFWTKFDMDRITLWYNDKLVETQVICRGLG
jgi:hypothetical protein